MHNEPNKCNDDKSKPIPIFLLIVIKSTTSQFDRRNAIRKTWGNETNINGVTMRRLFFLYSILCIYYGELAVLQLDFDCSD